MTGNFGTNYLLGCSGCRTGIGLDWVSLPIFKSSDRHAHAYDTSVRGVGALDDFPFPYETAVKDIRGSFAWRSYETIALDPDPEFFRGSLRIPLAHVGGIRPW